jgi:predicted nucleotide-binding protein (sugar kinase/HSP70/actin superfamily)
MKVTFPHLGNVYIPAKALLDDLGVNYIIPPFNNKKTLELGTRYTPEMACLPLKITIGNFIQAYEKGADTILMAGGCGPCRFGYYCEMQREILQDNGYMMDVLTMEPPEGDFKELLRRGKKLVGDTDAATIIKSLYNAARITVLVDQLEKLSFKIRPREVEKGKTSRVYKSFLNEVLFTKGSRKIKQLIKKTKEDLLKIEVIKSFKPMKIGIVGEIYTTIDSYTNFEIQSKLGEMGFEVDRYVTLSCWLIEHVIKKALHLPRDLRYAKAAKNYLGAMIGGHAQETVGNTILYANKGYDGVIQIYPLTCMPEIVAESILPAVQRDFDIPVLTLIIDELTGEAGYMTRVEAFTDLLIQRKGRNGVERQRVFSWN